MGELYERAEEWVNRENTECQRGRIERLVWLASVLPERQHLVFQGGWMAEQLYEEARYCFVYAQFLAAIVLGFAFIERTLTAMLYAAGRSDLERARIQQLLREATALGWLSQEEHGWLEHARKLRNPVTHFRQPLHKETIERRSVEREKLPYSLVEEDARHVMLAAMGLLAREQLEPGAGDHDDGPLRSG